MSLYSNDSTSPKVGTATFPTLGNKRFFQIGFLVLALSQVARVVEWAIFLGLHWSQVRESWNRWNWIQNGLYVLLTSLFVIVVLQYLSKSNNRRLVWILAASTGIAWIGYMTWFFGAAYPNALPALAQIYEWTSILNCTERPLGAIFYPFTLGSESASRVFFIYVGNADFIVRLLFLGLSLAKYPEGQRPAQRMQSRAVQGLFARE